MNENGAKSFAHNVLAISKSVSRSNKYTLIAYSLTTLEDTTTDGTAHLNDSSRTQWKRAGKGSDGRVEEKVEDGGGG